jgi:hypothetical protein
MAEDTTEDTRIAESISVAPPRPEDRGLEDAAKVGGNTESVPYDAGARLESDADDVDARIDEALEETFPTSDAPANTRPGSSDPAPSSGFDEEAERALAEGK